MERHRLLESCSSALNVSIIEIVPIQFLKQE
jgi:hypothetical protein